MSQQEENIPTEQAKFYSVYRGYYFKFGHEWAVKIDKYENKKKEPFSRVMLKVNTAMRRYLGAEKFGKYADLMEYLALKEGFIVKTEDNKIDIPFSTFELWRI